LFDGSIPFGQVLRQGAKEKSGNCPQMSPMIGEPVGAAALAVRGPLMSPLRGFAHPGKTCPWVDTHG